MTEDTRRNPASDDPCPLKADARRIDDLVHQRSRVQRRARSARRVVIPLVRRFGLNPVLGYLGAGAILGPLGLGSFIESFPLLYWFTVVDPKNVSGIANLGVVFLLFLIGMELSYDRLKAMRRLRVRQLADRTLLGGDRRGRGPVGNKAPVALILGACLALSSTAIVVEILSRQRRLSTSAGRASFATLLAQDLAVAPLLLFISIFGASEIRFGRCDARSRAHQRCRRARSNRHRQPRRDATAVPSGSVSGHERPVRRHDVIRDRRNGSGWLFHGARRLCRRTAACRDGIPQGHRDGH